MIHQNYDKYIDPKTGCMVYGTLGKIGSTDPEIDSMYMTSYYCYFSSILGTEGTHAYFNDCLNVFCEKRQFGVFRRYNSMGQNKTEESPPESHFNNPANLSRDNTLALIITLGRLGYFNLIKAFMKQMLKRYSFFQNTHTHKGVKKLMPDLATPDHWATFIRAYVEARSCREVNNLSLFIKSLVWFSLCFMDIFSVFQTLLHVFHTRFITANETGSELNFLASCVQRTEVLPTPLSIFANYIYYNWRAFPTEVAENGRYEDKAYLAAVQNFFSRGRRHKIMPPIDDLVIEVMKGR